MQATGIKRARSPDDDGTCRSVLAKSGRRTGGTQPGSGPRGGPSTSTPGGGGASSGASGVGGLNPGVNAFVPGPGGGFNPGVNAFVPGPGGGFNPGVNAFVPGPGGGLNPGVNAFVAPGSGAIAPYAEAGEEEEAAAGAGVMKAEEGGEMDDGEGDEMDIDDAPVKDNKSGSKIEATSDRTRVWNKYGADTVKKWRRDKIILYLPNLPSTFDSQWDQNPNYTVPLFQALRDALEGPDAVVNLTGLGANGDCNRVLGNADAGRLFETLYAHNRRLVSSKKSARERLNRTEGQRPIANKKHPAEQVLWQSLTRLEPDVYKAWWVWELLREATRRWMDTRFRNLRSNVRRYNDGTPRAPHHIPRQPFQTSNRVNMINTFVHGGDLRFDALMCRLNFGPARYQDQAYDQYMENLFKNYYGMSSEVGIWLSENGHKKSHGVDWRSYLYTINAYIITREAMLEKRGKNYSTVSFADMHEQLFFPYAQKVADLVNFAKKNPNTDLDANLVAEADRYRYTLETICQYWTDPSERIQGTDGLIYEGPLWNHHDRKEAWPPAKNFAQLLSFDAQNQIYTCADYIEPPIVPIDVPFLLNCYGSGQRTNTGVPQGQPAPLRPPLFGQPQFVQPYGPST